MKKYKVLLNIIIAIMVYVSSLTVVNAAACSITAKASKTTVVIGSSVTVTVTLSSSSSLGSWEWNVGYDTSKLRLTSTSANQHIVDYASGTGKKSASYTYTFTALAKGSATVSINNPLVYAFDESLMTITKYNASMTLMTQADLQATYSSNNNLSGLSVDGVNITPVFDKNTTSYEAVFEPNTTSIKINATLEDNKASVTGAGTFNVSEGANPFTIKVVAENGNEKVYNLVVTVKELTPIVVSIGKESYNVVRKIESLTIPANYIETKIKIQNEDVPAFTNEITGFTLIGLKDKDNKIDLYIYDDNNETYTLYNEINFNRIILYSFNPDSNVKVPAGYKKVTIKINNIAVTGWKLNKKSAYTLLYGMNVETGKKGFYTYDSKEVTLQKYNGEQVNELTNLNKIYLLVIIGLSFAVIGLVITTLIPIIKKFITKKDK